MNSMKVDVHRIMVLFLLSIYSLISTYSRAQDAAFLDWVIQTEGEGNMLGHQIRGSATDDAGNIIIVGGFTHTVNFNPLYDDYSIVTPNQDTLKNYMAKYSMEGELLWINLFDGVVFEHVKTDDYGNIYVGGIVYLPTDFDPGPDTVLLNEGPRRSFLASYDSEGAFRWVVALDQIASGVQSIQDLTICNETQEISFTGSFSGAIDFHPDKDIEVIHDTGSYFTRFIYLANFSLDGEYKWVNVMDNSRSFNSIVHRFYGVTSDDLGNIYLSGHFRDTLQLDPVGNAPPLVSVSEDSEGQDGFLAKYNKEGDFQWVAPIVGEGRLRILGSNTHEDEVYIIGDVSGDKTFYNAGKNDSIQLSLHNRGRPFIFKYHTETGDIERGFHLGVIEPIGASGWFINISELGDIYISGLLSSGEGFIDFNPSSSEEHLLSGSNMHYKCFLAKYTKDFAFQWAFSMPGGVFTGNSGFALLPDASVVVTGEYRGTADVSAYGEEPIYISTDFSPSINHHSFIAKYSQGFLSTLEEGDTNKEIVVYPNPSKETHTLLINGFGGQKVSVNLYDVQGRFISKVYEGDMEEYHQLERNISELPSGVYMYSIQTAKNHHILRFIK